MAPALFTRMSMSGCSSASRSMLWLSEMSNAWTSARTFQRDAMLSRAASRSAWVRDTRMTFTPSSARASAEARPMPFDAPVISAVLPRRFRSMMLPFLSSNRQVPTADFCFLRAEPFGRRAVDHAALHHDVQLVRHNFRKPHVLLDQQYGHTLFRQSAYHVG